MPGSCSLLCAALWQQELSPGLPRPACRPPSSPKVQKPGPELQEEHPLKPRVAVGTHLELHGQGPVIGAGSGQRQPTSPGRMGPSTDGHSVSTDRLSYAVLTACRQLGRGFKINNLSH